MLQIQQLCQDSGLSCARGIFIGLYSGIILIIALYCLIKLYEFMERVSYEMIPLSTCAIQSLLHFINIIFLISNSLQIAIVYFCLQTFILITQSFVHLFYKMTLTDNEFNEYKRYQKYSLISFYITFTIIIILYFVQIDDQNCKIYFDTGLAIQLLIIFISVFISWYYGQKLKYLVLKHEKTNETKTANYQITGIQLVLTITAILQLLMAILALTKYQGLQCNAPINNDQFYGFTASENIYLTFFSMIEMTPCILVPIIFFYLPQINQQQNHQGELLLVEQSTLKLSARPSLDFSGLMNMSIEQKL